MAKGGLLNGDPFGLMGILGPQQEQQQAFGAMGPFAMPQGMPQMMPQQAPGGPQPASPSVPPMGMMGMMGQGAAPPPIAPQPAQQPDNALAALQQPIGGGGAPQPSPPRPSPASSAPSNGFTSSPGVTSWLRGRTGASESPMVWDSITGGMLSELPPWATPEMFAGMPSARQSLDGLTRSMGMRVPDGQGGLTELTSGHLLKAAFPHWSDAQVQQALTGEAAASAPPPIGGGAGTSPAGNPLPPQRSPEVPGSPGIPPVSEGQFPNPPFEPFPTKIPVGQVAQGAQPDSGPQPGMSFSGPLRGMTYNEGRDLITDQAQEALAWLRERLATIKRP